MVNREVHQSPLSHGRRCPPIPRCAAAAAVLALGVAWLSNTAVADDERGAFSDVIDWPIIAIHAVLTPDGRVLSYGTSTAGEQGALTVHDIWDPAEGTGLDSHLTLPNETGVDSFCSGQLLLSRSGDVITTGGNSVEGVSRFDYRDDSRRSEGSLEDARWYGTLTTLPDGRLLIQGGTEITADGQWLPSTTPEISDDGVTWRLLFGASNFDLYTGGEEGRWWYPRSFVAPDGRVFGMTGSLMYYLDPEGDGDIEVVGNIESESIGATSTAVMYRPGLILQVGGGDYNSNDEGFIDPVATADAIVVDINGEEPVQSATSSMRYRRHWADSTVLPDGRVLVSGGSRSNNLLEGAANIVEIWDPETDSWTPGARGSIARLYHSTSLLLPDGRVLIAGGGAPGPLTNLNAELYEPPYLFDGRRRVGARPQIVDAPGVVEVGGSFDITVGDDDDISRVTLIKTGAVTHSFDMDQRFIELSFSQSGDEVTITAPANNNIATPGYYMLFVIDEDGTPSVGEIVAIDPA